MRDQLDGNPHLFPHSNLESESGEKPRRCCHVILHLKKRRKCGNSLMIKAWSIGDSNS